VSEIRRDIIIGRSIIIASNRAKRPKNFKNKDEIKGSNDCPFCNGFREDILLEVIDQNPSSIEGKNSWRVRVVDNKFPTLKSTGKLTEYNHGFFQKMNGIGQAEVLIESMKHNSSLGSNSLDHTIGIITALKLRYEQLAKDNRLKYIQIFKNFGAKAGASLEHPHWQIIGIPIVPLMVKEELEGVNKYYKQHHNCVYCDMIRYELADNQRVIKENEFFIAINPYASRYPFETWIIPRTHQHNFSDISKKEINALAIILRDMIKSFEVGFKDLSYNILLRTAPLALKNQQGYHWHLQILPRLNIQAGFELATAIFVNPVPPELATEELKGIGII
jgi:UDPglucose--hexose-1-phosphate uridylyltransferase